MGKLQSPFRWFRWWLSRPSGDAARAALAGGCCALLYLFIARQSNLDAGIGLFAFLGGHFAIAAVVLGYFWYAAWRGAAIGYGAVLLWAVVFRAIGVYGAPILEDDYFRYLLDGCVFVSSGTPYGIAPASLFAENDLPDRCRILLSQVNNPHLPTIYGPLLQYFFAALHLLWPVSVKALQLSLSVIDLGLILLLCRHAPARYVMLYAWCPLVVKEISFTAHPDVIGIALLLAAFHLRKLEQPGAAVVVAALACTTKVFALLLLPFLLWRLGLRYWLWWAATVALVYLPFLLQGASDLAVLRVFLGQWEFNASAFALASQYFSAPAARGLCFTLFGLWWLFYFACWARAGGLAGAVFPRGEWVFGIFLLLSPVLNPWYLLWLLPFAVLRPRAWPWTLAVAVPLSYISGLHHPESGLDAYQIVPWAYYAQLLAVAAALAVDGWRYAHRRPAGP